MGRYGTTKTEYRQGLTDRVGGGIGNVLSILMSAKAKEQQRKQEMQDAMELYKQKMALTPREWQPKTMEEALQFEKAKSQPTVSITQTPWGIQEIEGAREILGRTPEDWAALGKKKQVARTGGFLGLGFGPRSQKVYDYESPEAKADVESLMGMARGRLTGPKTTMTQRGTFGTQQPTTPGTLGRPDIDSMKPEGVDQADWDAASEEEKIELLRALGRL